MKYHNSRCFPSFLPTIVNWVVRKLLTSCFTWTQEHETFPSFSTRKQCDLHLYYKTSSQSQTPAIKFQAVKGPHPWPCHWLEHKPLLIANPIPKSCQHSCFPTEKSLPHLSTLYIQNLLVGKYLVCALHKTEVRMLTCSSARPVARLHECNQNNSVTPLSRSSHTLYSPYIYSKWQNKVSDYPHWKHSSNKQIRVVLKSSGSVFKCHLHKEFLRGL